MFNNNNLNMPKRNPFGSGPSNLNIPKRADVPPVPNRANPMGGMPSAPKQSNPFANRPPVMGGAKPVMNSKGQNIIHNESRGIKP